MLFLSSLPCVFCRVSTFISCVLQARARLDIRTFLDPRVPAATRFERVRAWLARESA